MVTCFANTHFTQNKGFGKKLLEGMMLLILMSLPIAIFILSIYKGIESFNNIQMNKNKVELKFFWKYSIYLGAYIVLAAFLILVYLVESIIYINNGKIGDNKPFRYFAYSIAMASCGTSVFTGLIKLILTKEVREFICCRSLKNGEIILTNPLIQYNDTESEKSTNLIDRRETLTAAELEKMEMMKLISNIYVGACYCLFKGGANITSINKISKNDGTNSIKHEITAEKIKEEGFYEFKNDSYIKKKMNSTIICEDHAPLIFSYLRHLDNINIQSMIISLLPSKNKEGIRDNIGGRGGGLFLHSYDNQFILKSLKKEELTLLKNEVAYELANHITKHPESIISRIYGVFTIKTGGEDSTFFIMRNVFGIFPNVKVQYDLKGSKLDREAGFNNEVIDKLFQGKDIDFFNNEFGGLMLPKEYSEKLKNIAQSDSLFFSKLGIMDYSLFVVKIGVNLDELKFLFGKDIVSKLTNEYQEIMKGINSGEGSKAQCEDNKDMITKQNEDINYNNITFDKNLVPPLMKYIFPRLDPINIFVIAIIDFFQLYTLQKIMETEIKKFKAKAEDISSMEPAGYQSRFMEQVKKLCDTIKLLKE